MGGYIGARLAKAGYATSFIARGGHLESMLESGLKIVGPDEAFVIQPIPATRDPKDIGPVDFVIFCVKLWDTETAGALPITTIPLATHGRSIHSGQVRPKRPSAEDVCYTSKTSR